MTVSHRMSGTSEHIAWLNMKARCSNPSRPDYERYGGRDIKVCDRWLKSFENFYKDMGPRPSKGMSLDRINNNGNYEPENCKWSDAVDQTNNMRNNLFLTFQGVTLSVSDWSWRTGLNYYTIRWRMSKGWSITRILEPVR